MPEILSSVLGFFHHMPESISLWSTQLGPLVYVVLFAIFFSETGLVILPFLPGDSLLFALGALTAMPGTYLQLPVLFCILPVAVWCGDFTNYSLGRYLGRKIGGGSVPFVNPKHIAKTQAFYIRHGGKTILLARFIPIIRTYAPFVAGLGEMRPKSFVGFSLVGALVWIVSFLALGYFFGNIPSVKSNFQFVILAIIVISVLPAIIEFWRNRDKATPEPGVQRN